MKTTLKFAFLFVLALCLCIAAFAAEDTVYVDGVGTDANCYAKLADAVTAVADGGTVVLTADYATPTGSATHLPAKSFTLTAQNGAVLTLGRTFFIYGDVVFDNITIKNGASASFSFIYCSGYNLTVNSNVQTIANGSRYLSIFGGTSDSGKYPIVPAQSDLKLFGGSWHTVLAGNNQGTFTNTVNIVIDGATVANAINVGNNSGAAAGTANVTLKSGSVADIKGATGTYNVTLSGGSVSNLTLNATVAPEVGKTVTVSAATGTITTVVPEGYELVQNGTEYSIKEIVVEPEEPEAPTTVYVDGTGATEGAYATLQEAVEALHADGGSVIVCGDTTVSGVVELAKKNGKMTITAQNGAKLTIARTFKLLSEVEFDNIELVSTSSTHGLIYAQGNKLTFGENVVTSRTDGAKWFSVYGGSSAGTVNFNSHIVAKAGSYNVIYGGNYQGTFSGTATVEVSNITVEKTLYAKNSTGTFDGTASLILDLRGYKTVSAGTFEEDPTEILVDEGCEAVLANGMYFQREIIVADVLYVDGTGNTEGAYTSLAEAIVAYTGGEIIVCGDTAVSEDVFVPEKEKDIIISSKNGAVLTLGANISFAKNANDTSVTFNLPVKANDAKIFGGCRNVTFTENFSVDGKLDFFGGVDTSALTDNADAITEKEYTVTVNGGTFENFALGSYRYEYKHMVGSIAAPVTLNVNGGTFNSSFSVSGMAILADNATLNITGGTFNCPIYVRGGMGTVNTNGVKASQTVKGDRKYYAIDGDIAVNISGGTFNGGFIGAYEEQTAYTQVMRGNYTVSVTGGTFADGTVFDATQVKAYANSDKKATIAYSDTYNFSVVRFDNVNGSAVTYDEPIRIAYIGDSITEGYVSKDRLTDSYPAVIDTIAAEKGTVDLVSSNYGISASGILTSASYRFTDYLGYSLILEETDADYIVIAIGTNDSAAGGTTGALNTFAENYSNLVGEVGAIPTTKKVFVTNALVRDNENSGQIRVTSVVRPLQERIAKEFAAKDADKYVFVDLYRLTLPYAAEDKLLSSDNLHPNTAGYATMANVLYGVIFEGQDATPDTYYSNDVYVSASGKPFASGTKDDPVSRLDIAFAMLPAGEEATVHIIGKVAFAESLYTPITPSKLTIVGEGSGAILENGSASFKLGSDIKFDNITLATTDSTEFYGCYYDVEMTDTVSLTGDWSFFAGHNIYAEGATNAAHDTVASASDDKDCNIILLANGTFTNFALGNRRCLAKAPFGTYSGNLTAYIGDNITVSGTEHVGIVGQNYLTGSITVEMPEELVLPEYAPTHTVSSPIVYDSAKNTGKVTVETYKSTPVVVPATVYVDGTGATEGAYATLQDAVAALHADGGNVIVCGDTTVSGVVELAKKNGKMTITGQNGAKLTIARTFKITSEVEFNNIELVSTSGTYGFVYAQGNKLTIGENVTTSKTSGAKWLSVLGGTSSGTVEYNSHLVIKAGTYNVIYGGNNQGTFSGTATVEVSNVAVTGTLSAKNYTGTFNGTSTLIIDLRGNKTVSAGTYKDGETPVLFVDEGYEAVLADGVYSQQEKKEDIPVEPKTLFVDGTGKTDGAYASLEAALAEMPGGGTVVITGNTAISSATVLPETAAVIITSVYDGEDYTDVATLQISANVTLGGDTTFENIIIERVKNADGNYYIAAAGHKLVIEETAIFLNYTGYQWLSIVGGALSGTHTGGSHLVIKGGHFRNVFGGNYKGEFYGDSKVEITGGMYENAVCGGSYLGNFTGDAYVTFGGDAAMLYVTSAPSGLVGGSLGSGGSSSYTFTGDTHLTLTGGAAVTTNVIGGSRGKDVTNIGDTYLTIEGAPFVYYAIYAGGYAAPVNGNTYAVVNGGTLWGDFFGGSQSSTVSGNSKVEINGGRICYYKTNDASSWPEPASTKNVYGGGSEGSTLGGTATVIVRGGSIYGDVNGIAAANATVTGKTSVTVYGGEIVGKIGTADEKVIDLSGGTSLSLGVSSTVDSLIGGGNLMLAANNLLTVGTLSGKTALSINGLPLPKKYVTVTTVADGAELNYVAQNGEALTQNGNDFAIDFEGSYAKTVVTVHFLNGCEVRTRAGDLDSGAWLTPETSTATSATYTLTPGLYNSVALYSSSNYQRKSFYIDGRSESMDVYVEFEPKQGIGYESRAESLHTDEVLAAFYDTKNIEGFKTPDSPFFINHPNGSRRFTTHEESEAFLAEKQASCDYMYLFYPAKSTVYGIDFPVVIFTKDAIPEGATIEEIGEIVSATKGREVFMISGGVHGGEPSGAEGALAYISELCGEYGEEIFASGRVGAVIILPRMSPDGLYNYARDTADDDTLNANINRDYLALANVESQTFASVYHAFMPTVTVDLHESLSSPVWSESDSLSDIYDGGLSFYSNISGPHAKTMDILYGDLSAASDNMGEQMGIETLRRVEEKGMRIWFYDKNVAPNFSRNYCANLGSFSYTTEIPGTAADANYARRVFTQIALVKELVAITLESDGAVAAAVAAAREKIALSAQIFDARRPIVIDQATARLPEYGLLWNNPLPGPDGTIRYANNPQWTDVYNVAARYRSMATAYVIPADLEKIDTILTLLNHHGIGYTYLAEGSTLTLSQYGGTKTRATVGEAKEYTFANGAYLIPVDGYRAYLTSFLFEPDNTDITSGIGTLVQCEYLTTTDIYRSTENYIGAKYGVVGTYKAFAVPADKVVASVSVNGTATEFVTEGGNVFIATPASKEYAVTFTYTDGSEETYLYGYKGDLNGDGNVGVVDVLIALRSILNGSFLADADLDGNGKLTLIDIVKLMKLATR